MLKIRFNPWGIQRIFLAILFAPATALLVIGWVMHVAEILTNIASIPTLDVKMEVVLFLWVIGGVFFSYLWVSPKQQDCIEPVRDFVRTKTLKRCIRSEEFEEPIVFYNVKGIKPQYMHMYVSKYWVCIGYGFLGKITNAPYCIPRNMIELMYIRQGKVSAKDFQKSSFSGHQGLVLTIVTKIGDQYSVGYINKSEVETVKSMLSAFMNTPVYMACDNEALQFYGQRHNKMKMKQAFCKEISDEQSFLDYVYR